MSSLSPTNKKYTTRSPERLEDSVSCRQTDVVLSAVNHSAASSSTITSPLSNHSTRVSTIFINEILHVTLGRNLSKKKQPPLFVRSCIWSVVVGQNRRSSSNWRLIRTRKTEKMQERVRRSEKVNATCPPASRVIFWKGFLGYFSFNISLQRLCEILNRYRFDGIADDIS